MLIFKDTEIPYYIELCKPNVVALMILNINRGNVFSLTQNDFTECVNLWKSRYRVSCVCWAAFNHILDRQYDAIMGRTKFRPLPLSRLPLSHALMFATLLMVSGTLIYTG